MKQIKNTEYSQSIVCVSLYPIYSSINVIHEHYHCGTEHNCESLSTRNQKLRIPHNSQACETRVILCAADHFAPAARQQATPNTYMAAAEPEPDTSTVSGYQAEPPASAFASARTRPFGGTDDLSPLSAPGVQFALQYSCTTPRASAVTAAVIQ